jgi:inosine-uridine nucleoside N-ribohydrolase
MLTRLFCALVMAALVAAMLPLSVVAQEEVRTPVVIDTDMAQDDWWAILYLLQHDEIEVLAITVTGTGIAHCDPGVQNTMNLLALAGNPDIPVACGRETPLEGDHAFPDEWREGPDGMMGISLPENPNPLPEDTASDLLTATIQESPAEITLVALGPLTNLAEAFTAEPELVENVAMIYIMAGAIDVPGNVWVPGVTNPVADWNTYIDPLATQQVLESGAPITFVTLDATKDVPVTYEFYQEYRDSATTPEAKFAIEVVSFLYRDPSFCFWDALCAAIATDESLTTIEERTLIVITQQGTESGRLVENEDGTTVRVAFGADQERFEALFMTVLNNTSK